MSGGRTHIPKHHNDKCTVCGGCTWHCPASVFPVLQKEKDSLRGILYQTSNYDGEKTDRPPCTMACPLGQQVPEYIGAIANGDIDKAASIIRKTNALPAVCGRTCIASCMKACTRAAIDDGVDIRALKRFAVKIKTKPIKPNFNKNSKTVAIIGSGPAGLAAAHYLVSKNIKVVVFDNGIKPGGALATTIPNFILPSNMLDADIDYLAKSKIEFKTGVTVGKEISFAELEKQYNAVLIATGASRGLIPKKPGFNLVGVVSAVDFCKNNNVKLKKSVVIMGGGKAALQSARTAIRLGATDVKVVYHLPLMQWPSEKEEIEFAKEEGVKIIDLKRIVKADGQYGNIETVYIKSVKAINPDNVDRHELKNYGKEEIIKATTLVVAGERRSFANQLPKLEKIKTGVLFNLIVDNKYRTGRPSWYAAGEAATGSATVVDSMATGRLAAMTIERDFYKHEKGIK